MGGEDVEEEQVLANPGLYVNGREGGLAQGNHKCTWQHTALAELNSNEI